MGLDPGAVDYGLAAPLAPILTIARNVITVTCTTVGIVCLLVLPLGWAPMPNALVALIAGTALVIGSIFAAVRRVPLIRRAARATENRGADESFAFLQAQFLGGARRAGDTSTEGFVLVWDDRIEIDYRRDSLGAGSPREQRNIRFDEIGDVFAREATSMSYRQLIVMLVPGEEIRFTLAPKNGSGLRGPSDDETADAIETLRTRMRVADAAAITLSACIGELSCASSDRRAEQEAAPRAGTAAG